MRAYMCPLPGLGSEVVVVVVELEEAMLAKPKGRVVRPR